ncbi:zinc-dependent peptidase [Lysobacter sp. A3-1-A15]|uniref:M90 family metallopeptidase n=1 Tax=Novilysobacter viscosus TaxID=3098602 RepID=UPI003982D7B0
MFGLFKRLRGAPDSINPAVWRDARDALPWLQPLDHAREARLRNLAARFLHEKTITPIGELQLDPSQRCMLAALCCLPLLEFGEAGLQGWSQLIVYPEAFRVNRTHVDAAGVMHEWEDELIGEAWQSGPLVLSWADVLADCQDPTAGFCVATHEMAHKIDALDGLLDGTPPLPRPWQKAWARDFQQAYDALGAQVEAGVQTPIDGYAAEAPEEFFAVATEYHFSDPALLREVMPDVAAHLRRFYGESPFASA